MCGLSKKKMPYLHLIDEAIELIKTEVRIVNLHIKYPEQFQQHANKLFLSPLQLADKTSLINIMEIVSGLFLSKRIVNKDGSTTDFRIIRSVDKYLDKEALRVLNGMPKWKPGKQKGVPVRVRYTVPINFKLS